VSTEVSMAADQLDCLYRWGQNDVGIFVDGIQYTVR